MPPGPCHPGGCSGPSCALLGSVGEPRGQGAIAAQHSIGRNPR
ncbi:uncharacterized protein AruCF_1592 [Achromobacter ruhlandii]|nr:uncharacterized protein AruCF_1592 [Achromobacter ruhlandii]